MTARKQRAQTRKELLSYEITFERKQKYMTMGIRVLPKQCSQNNSSNLANMSCSSKMVHTIFLKYEKVSSS